MAEIELGGFDEHVYETIQHCIAFISNCCVHNFLPRGKFLYSSDYCSLTSFCVHLQIMPILSDFIKNMIFKTFGAPNSHIFISLQFLFQFALNPVHTEIE